jgi:dihydroxyacetone kinase-like predicted kinase
VVEGGQTMNPSTESLLQAVDATGAGEVIILPNNKNVIMTAQQVSDLSGKEVRVVSTRTVPEGISALLNLDPGSGLDDNVNAMAAALKGVQTIEVTRAVRSTSMNGVKIKDGDVIALVNGKIRQAGDDEVSVIDGALDSLEAGGYELLTIYGGAEVTEETVGDVAAHIRERLPNLTVETQRGEQDHYPYILSLE